jgi:hypothetical protein
VQLLSFELLYCVKVENEVLGCRDGLHEFWAICHGVFSVEVGADELVLGRVDWGRQVYGEYGW